MPFLKYHFMKSSQQICQVGDIFTILLTEKLSPLFVVGIPRLSDSKDMLCYPLHLWDGSMNLIYKELDSKYLDFVGQTISTAIIQLSVLVA